MSTSDLASRQAPEPRRRKRRWWPAPLVAGLATMILVTVTVSRSGQPTGLIELITGDRASARMMVEGGAELELAVDPSASAGVVARIAKRLSGAGFHIVRADGDAIVARLPGQLAQFEAVDQLEALGLRHPAYIELLAPPGDPALLELLAAAKAERLTTGDVAGRELVVFNEGFHSWRIPRISPELQRAAAAHHFRLRIGLERDGSARLFVFAGECPDERDNLDFDERDGVGYLRLSDAGRRAAASWPEGTRIALVWRSDLTPSQPELVAAIADPSSDLSGNELRFSPLSQSSASIADRFVPWELGGLVDLVAVEGVSPTLNAAGVLAVRAVIGSAVGLLCFIVVAIAGRLSGPADPPIEPVASRANRIPLLLSTALAGAIVALVAAPLLPGPFPSPAMVWGGDWRPVTLLGFGVGLLAAGFALVQLASLTVPRWRRLLLADPGGRAPIARGLIASAILAAAIAAAVTLEDAIDVLGTAESGASTALYVGGAALAAMGVAVIGRFALAGPAVCSVLGVLVGMAFAAAADLAPVGRRLAWAAVGGHTGALLAAASVAVAGVTWSALQARFGSQTAPLRAPIGGVVPIGLAIAALELAFLFDLPTLERTFWIWFLALAAVTLPLWWGLAALELRPLRTLGSVRLANAAPGERHQVERRALAASAGLLIALIAIESLALSVWLPAFALIVALGTAAVMDLSAELRARWRRPHLAPAWHAHQHQLASLLAGALASRGIAVHLRAIYLRSCLGVLGAVVPVSVLVDRDRIGEAREIIGALLGCAPAPPPPDRSPDPGS
jgi:hypothetical protein